ncbi:MAG: DUF3443 domain-containing protein [Candidatus Accumulibacter sp.]|jgi:predicted aspartyl protease|nr:DUF3443 domain-containing protein [Accumulibacter sp.]
MRHPILFSLALALVIFGCGGGGGGGGGGSSTPAPPTPPTPPTQSTAANQLQITVGRPNLPFVSVEVCVPGTSTCKTIDRVIVDTGSSGLRLVSSSDLTSLSLPPVSSLAECVTFVSGYTWGAIRSADVKLAGQTKNMAIHVIDDTTTVGSAPDSCTGAPVNLSGINGILGVGVFVRDGGFYYACSGSCTRTYSVPDEQQVRNPVALLDDHNNGVVIDLRAVSDSGAAGPFTGTLYLGIGTHDNNSLGSATVISVDAKGEFSTSFKGTSLSGYIDSGSNGLFFPDSTIPECGVGSRGKGFYCPTSTLYLTATNAGTNVVNFQVANAATLCDAASNVAFNNLAAPADGYFNWGLPFFFGRKVFTAIEDRNTTGTGNPGPYVAYIAL